MQIHSRELLFFIQVACFSSFTDAANAMNIPASTVSRKILDLESRVQQPLFIRSKYGVSLTEFGQQFLAASRKVELSLSGVKSLVKGKLLSHIVVIEALPSLVSLLVGDFLSDFNRRFPDIVVDVRTITAQQQTTAINSYIRLQSASFSQSLYRFTPFLHARKGFYIHPKLLVRYPELTHPNDLVTSNIPIIGVRNSMTTMDQWAYSEQGSEKVLTITPNLIVDDAAQARDAAIKGAGVTWNYDVLMAEPLKQGAILELFDTSISIQEFAYIVTPRGKALNESEQILVDALCQYYR